MEPLPVTCPTCFEEFPLPPVSPGDLPCDIDYDCEICCHPLRVTLDYQDGIVTATAYGLDDL